MVKSTIKYLFALNVGFDFELMNKDMLIGKEKLPSLDAIWF